MVRKSDYFGKLEKNLYVILLTHCSIEDSLTFVEKLKRYVKHEHIMVVEYMPGDLKETLLEKVAKAKQDNKKISIEV